VPSQWKSQKFDPPLLPHFSTDFSETQNQERYSGYDPKALHTTLYKYKYNNKNNNRSRTMTRISYPYQYIFWFNKLTTKERTQCKTVAKVQSITNSLTECTRGKLGSLLYAVTAGCNAYTSIVKCKCALHTCLCRTAFA